MQHHGNDVWLKLPTFILAIFSLIGSIYVCISAYLLRHVRKLSKRQTMKPLLITHCVFWMSFSDIMINIWILLLWTPAIFNSTEYYPSSTCALIATFGQFFLIASSCFYSVIIYITWVMVTAMYSAVVHSQMNLFHSTPNTDIDTPSPAPYHRLNDNLTPSTFSLFSNKSSYTEETRNSFTKKLNKIVIRGGIFSLIMAIVLTIIPLIGMRFCDNCFLFTSKYDYNITFRS